MSNVARHIDPGSIPRPAPGEMVMVQPGIHWVRLQLPFRLNHVNVWILDDVSTAADGYWIVDTGFNLDDGRAVWSALLDGPLSGRPLIGVIVTHMHPDHAGLAGWLCRETGAPLYMTQTEWLASRLLAIGDSDDLYAGYLATYRKLGLGESATLALADRARRYRRSVSRPPAHFKRLRAGMTLSIGGREWVCRTFEGHSPEHLCLYAADDAIMIVGDQILPKITPNVSVWPMNIDADPLAGFQSALAELEQVDDEVLALPGHGGPFCGIATRARETAKHHEDRLERTLVACEGGADVSAIVAALFRPDLDNHEIFFAVGEALAHANRLISQHELKRTERGDGTFLFERI